MDRYLADLYLAFRELIGPLQERVSSLERLEYLFYRYGWNVSLDEDTFNKISEAWELKASLEEFLTVADSLQQRLDESPESSLGVQDVTTLAETATRLITSISKLRSVLPASVPAPLNDPQFWTNIADHLFDDLLEEYLRIYHPNAYLLLHFGGVIRYETTNPAEPLRRPYSRVVVDRKQLGALLRNPVTALKHMYNWGDDPSKPFQYELFSQVLIAVFRAVQLPTTIFAPGFRSALGGLPENSEYHVQTGVPALRTTLLDAFSPRDQVIYEIGFELFPATTGAEEITSGIILSPIIRGGTSGELPLGNDFMLRWKFMAGSGESVGFVVSPKETALIAASPAFETELEITRRDAGPWYLFGNPKTARLELLNPSIRFSFEGKSDDLELRLRLGSNSTNGNPSGRVVLPLGDADSFIAKTVKLNELSLSFSPEVIWSSKTGLQINGKPTFAVDLPMSLTIGPIRVQSLTLGLRPREEEKDARFQFEMSAGVSISLGPITGNIERIGFLLELDFDSTDKNVGFARISAGFKSPSGIGLSLDTPGISGGGHIFIDEASHQYAGILSLTLTGGITITAVAVITTRLPNGVAGFSFVVMITATGFKPIPLGLGFTLTAIGGLLAINRTCNEEFLRQGIKDQTLNHLLFPRDPIRDAPQLIGALNNAFPPRAGSYLFGPVIQICWGTPTLIKMDLGLILELGARRRLIILGRVSAIMPTEEHDLIRLQMNAIGVIDFDQGSVSLDAVLYNSRLAGKFPLTGSMALRLSWGSKPIFALSIGGFHPAFKPPPQFPVLERLAISFSSTATFRLRAECYLALTANTLQWGAKVELYAKAGDFSIEGRAGFDVLIQFVPFAFVADFYASVQLKYGSRNLFAVKVQGAIAGPKPLHVRGKASFEIFWCDFSVRFDKTLISGEQPPSANPVVVFELLKAALLENRNWSDRVSEIDRRPVSLRERQTDQLTLHPLGTVSVKQTVVPLDLTIDKFGNATPSDARFFKIQFVTINGDNTPFDPVEDFFAPAEFLELTDDEKLASPSFEPMPAGVRVGKQGLEFAQVVADIIEDEVIKFETIIVDKKFEAETGKKRKGLPHEITRDLFDRHISLGAAAQRSISRKAAKSRAEERKNSEGELGWTIVSTIDGSAQPAPDFEAGTVSSYAKSLQAYRKLKAEDSETARERTMVRILRPEGNQQDF